MTGRVAVAILTWRGEATTRRCLESLRRPEGWTGSIAIIDNGSGTGEGKRLAADFGADAITLPENGGVPGGYNAAIAWAVRSGMSHVVLANNDLIFTDPTLPTRLASRAGPGVAAVGPIIREPGGSIWSAGVSFNRWLGHARRLRQPRHARPYTVDALDGSCLLVSVVAACRIGGLAPEYFLYWEETDWCERARRAGMTVIVDPATSVTHVGRASGDLPRTRRQALRNSLLFVRRNLRGLHSLSAPSAWLFGRTPLFVLRRIREGAGARSIAADIGWAVGWHLRDIARRGWHLAPDGPELCK